MPPPYQPDPILVALGRDLAAATKSVEINAHAASILLHMAEQADRLGHAFKFTIDEIGKKLEQRIAGLDHRVTELDRCVTEIRVCEARAAAAQEALCHDVERVERALGGIKEEFDHRLDRTNHEVAAVCGRADALDKCVADLRVCDAETIGRLTAACQAVERCEKVEEKLTKEIERCCTDRDKSYNECILKIHDLGKREIELRVAHAAMRPQLDAVCRDAQRLDSTFVTMTGEFKKDFDELRSGKSAMDDSYRGLGEAIAGLRTQWASAETKMEVAENDRNRIGGRLEDFVSQLSHLGGRTTTVENLIAEITAERDPAAHRTRRSRGSEQ
jgi:chromosome segregation ATPase